MPFAIPSDIASWIGKDIDATRQAELVSTIAAAQDWVAHQAGIRSLEKEAAAVTTYLDATEANGENLWLPADVRPVWHSGSDLMTVTEGGISVSLAASYSATAGAVIRGANQFKRVCLWRAGGWSKSGASDIAVTCKVGWHLDTGVLIVPQDVRRLCIEVAWLLFNSYNWVGKQNVSKAGSAVSLENDLSPFAADTLRFLRGA